MTFTNHIAAETPANRGEVMLGRDHWTVADYRRAGEEQTDRHYPDLSPGERKLFVDCFVRLNCPASKLLAHIAARNAEFDTGRPDWASNREDVS